MAQTPSHENQDLRILVQQSHYGFDHFFWNQPAEAKVWFSDENASAEDKPDLASAA